VWEFIVSAGGRVQRNFGNEFGSTSGLSRVWKFEEEIYPL